MLPQEKRIHTKARLKEYLAAELPLYRCGVLQRIFAASEKAILRKHQLLLRKAQVFASLVIIGISSQGVLIHVHALLVVLLVEGKVAKIIVGTRSKPFVGSLHHIPQNLVGLIQRAFRVVRVGTATLSNVGEGKVVVCHIALRIVLEGTLILHLSLGISLLLK